MKAYTAVIVRKLLKKSDLPVFDDLGSGPSTANSSEKEASDRQVITQLKELQNVRTSCPLKSSYFLPLCSDAGIIGLPEQLVLY